LNLYKFFLQKMQRANEAIREALPLPKCVAAIVCEYHFYLNMQFTTIEKHALDCAVVDDTLVVVTRREVRVVDMRNGALLHCTVNKCGFHFAVAVDAMRVALFSADKCSLFEVHTMRRVKVVQVAIRAVWHDFSSRVAVLGGRVYVALSDRVMQIAFDRRRWIPVLSDLNHIRDLGTADECLVICTALATSWYASAANELSLVCEMSAPCVNGSIVRCCQNEILRFDSRSRVATAKNVQFHASMCVSQWAPLADNSFVVSSAETLFIIRDNALWTQMEHQRAIKKMWALSDGTVVCFGDRLYLLQ
jgi:hypothetical protein